jgi:hypothetical protein
MKPTDPVTCNLEPARPEPVEGATVPPVPLVSPCPRVPESRLPLWAQTELETLRAESTHRLHLLRAIVDHFHHEHRGWPARLDAPGHAHVHPGHWDADDTPCPWCALWQQIESEVREKE